MKSYVLVANDKSPSDALGKLGDALEKDGHDVVRFLGGGNLTATEADIALAITSESIVLIGMSSKPANARAEIFASLVAMEVGAEYGYFSDTFRCYRRAWFPPSRANASVLFIASEAEREDAEKLFPKAKVAVTGNPSWEGFEDPNLSDGDIKKAIGARLGEPIILVPLNKAREASLDVASECLRSCAGRDAEILVVVGPHPGAVEKNSEEPAYYDGELAKVMEELDGSGVRYVVLNEKAMGVRSQDVLRVAQFVLSAQSATTDLQAAFLRIPVFNYLEHPETKERLLAELGQATAPLGDLGATHVITDLSHLWDGALQHGIIAGQKAAFPEGAPLRGSAVRRMSEALM